MSWVKSVAVKTCNSKSQKNIGSDSECFHTGNRWWAFFVLLISVLFVLGCYNMVNGDIWWHLRTGEYILESGSIPSTNLFAYTNADTPWIDLHWLFQVAVAVTYEHFGTTGLVVFKSLIGAAAFGLLFLTVRQRLPGSLLAICWLPFVWIYAGRYHVRPEMFSHFYLAFTLYILHRHSVGDRRWIWLLVPLQIVWVNSQGLFILELCVLGAYAIDVQCRRENRSKINNIWSVVTICLLASLINPYGIEGALFPLELLGKVGGEHRSFFQLLAGETQGMAEFLATYGLDGVVRSTTPRWMFLTAPICIAALLWSSFKRRDLVVYRWLLVLGFGYLAWNMNRNASLYAIVWGFVLSGVIGDEVKNYTRCMSSPNGEAFNLMGFVSGLVFVFLGFSVFSAAVDIVQTNEVSGLHYPVRRAGFSEHSWYNHDAARFVAALPGVDDVYVHYNGTGFAGLVIYHGYARGDAASKRVFADARLEANTVTVLEDFLAVLGDNDQDVDSMELVLKKYSDTLPALVFKNSDLMVRRKLLDGLIKSKKWRSVYMSSTPNLADGITVFVPDDVVKLYALDIVSVGLLRR